MPIGGEPSAEENAALAAALLGYAKRSRPDDFASRTSILEQHQKPIWQPALLTVPSCPPFSKTISKSLA